jgi:hypothetical protein
MIAERGPDLPDPIRAVCPLPNAASVTQTEKKVRRAVDGVQKSVKVHRLDQVTIRSQPVCIPDRFLDERRAENDHRGRLQLRMLFDKAQDRTRIGAREIEIEEDESGLGSGIERWQPAQEQHGFFAVRNFVNGDDRLDVAERFADETNIRRVIFNDKNFARLRQGCESSFPVGSDRFRLPL